MKELQRGRPKLMHGMHIPEHPHINKQSAKKRCEVLESLQATTNGRFLFAAGLHAARSRDGLSALRSPLLRADK